MKRCVHENEQGHIGALENAVGELSLSAQIKASTNRNQLLATACFHLEAADKAEALKHFQIHLQAS